MDLTSYVKIYRTAGKPPVIDGVFCGQLDFNPENVKIIDALRLNSRTALEELLIDGKDISEKDELPTDGLKIEFTVRLPSDSSNRFHATIDDLIINAPQISKGEMPNNFYIIDHDYHSLDPESPVEIKKLTAICSLIEKLSELAHYHDSKAPVPYLKLVFVQPNQSGSTSTIVLDTKIEKSMLSYAPPDVCLLDELTCGMVQTDPHYNAKKDIFGVTITDFLSKRHPEGDFAYLIKYWCDFKILYQNNLGTYLSGFAFHKAKREVAETEFHIAEQFSKVISEIAGKLLGIPLSFAAVLAVARSDSFIESILLTIGLLLAGVVISAAVRNQTRQLERIKHAKSIMFSSIEGKRETYPIDLKTAVGNMTENLNKNETELFIMLWVFRVLSWIPVICGVLILLYRYPPNWI